MKKRIFALLPIALLALTGCNTIQQLNCLVNNSTDAIDGNREAVEYSTQVIHQNASLIQSSTETVKENRHQLESLKE